MKNLIILLLISLGGYGQVISESEMRQGMTNILNLQIKSGTDKLDKLREYIETRVTKEAAGKFAGEIAADKTTWAKLFYSKFTATTVNGLVNNLKAIANGSFGHRALDDEKVRESSDLKEVRDLFIQVNDEIRESYTNAFLSIYSTLDGVKLPEKGNGLEAGILSVFHDGLDALTEAIPISKVAKSVVNVGKNAILAITEEDSKANSKYMKELDEATATNNLKDILSKASEAASARFAINIDKLDNMLIENSKKEGPGYYDKLLKSLKEINSFGTKKIGNTNYQTLFFKYELLENLINAISPMYKDGFIVVEIRLSKCNNFFEFLNYLEDQKEDCPTIVRSRFSIYGSLSSQFITALNNLFTEFTKGEPSLKKIPGNMNIPLFYRIHPFTGFNEEAYFLVPVRKSNGIIKVVDKISRYKFLEDYLGNEKQLDNEITSNNINVKLMPYKSG